MDNIDHILRELTNIDGNIIQHEEAINNLNNNLNHNANILQAFIDQMNLITVPPVRFIDADVAADADADVADEIIDPPAIRDVEEVRAELAMLEEMEVAYLAELEATERTIMDDILEEEERRRNLAACTIQRLWTENRSHNLQGWLRDGAVNGMVVDENFDRAGWGLCSEFQEAGGD